MEPLPLHMGFMAVMHRMKAVNLGLLLKGLSGGEYFLLEALSRHQAAHPDLPGIYAFRLAKSLGVSPPAVSRMLHTLESRGLLERDVDRNNRRNTFIRLTEEGERLRQSVSEQFEAFHREVLESIGETDTRELVRLMNRLIDAMESKIKTINERESACSKSSNT